RPIRPRSRRPRGSRRMRSPTSGGRTSTRSWRCCDEVRAVRYVLAIDAGTTGITVLAVGDDARIHATGYREFPQYFPHAGWVEHDADEIWTATVEAARDALAQIDASDIVAV